MSNCIRAVKLCKKYRHTEVVKSIDFQVEQGQLFAFLGPNGAGKSTTMNMLTTLLPKSGGKLYIDGLDMDIHRKEVKEKIGVVFQEDVLDKDLTVEENLRYRGGLYYGRKQMLQRRIDEITRQLSMEMLLQKKYGECSGGQRRIAQIGRALLARPRLLVLDEPTTGLDPVARRHVWQTLLQLREADGMTIFYATHYMEEAALADQICVLDHGDILMCDSLYKVKERTTLPPARQELEQLYFHLLEEGKPV